MLFNSLPFVILVLVTFLLYYIIPIKQYQLGVLIAASLFFYAFNSHLLLSLLLFSIGINIFTSWQVQKSATQYIKKLYALTGVSLNLFILIFFKYSPLVSVSFFPKPNDIGQFLLSIPLPVGISFFTFQGISLLVDTFRGNKAVEATTNPKQGFLKHATNTGLFIAFFPQLVAGPIVKAHDFFPQIGIKKFSDIDWYYVFKYTLTGYFLKMVVADNLKDFTGQLEYPYFLQFSSAELLIYLFGYSMQIFADFAGYSLIAIGISRLFGYKIMHNFNFPYISKSFSDFWRRWHISLSTFLKEYLYIPLGGNKKGTMRTYINLMLVMLLGGLWHGAAWSYMVWGGAHGLALAAERFLRDKKAFSRHHIYIFVKGLWVFILVTFAWLLFKLPDFSHVIEYLKALKTNANEYTDTLPMLYILTYSAPVILYHMHYLLRRKWVLYQQKGTRLQYMAYGVMLFLLLLNSGTPQDFIYFQF